MSQQALQGEVQPLRGGQLQAAHVGDEHQHAGELLPALGDAELRGLPIELDRVAAGVGQADDLGLRTRAW
ncbi:MAG: hypothetical protein U1E95_07500 [Rubrivivax sp.]